jgi:hypothetical protein
VAFPRNENAFDVKAVFEAQQNFLCAILRLLDFDHRWAVDPGRLSDRFAEIARERCHGVEGEAAGLMELLHDLAGAVFFLAGGGNEFLQLREGEVRQIK